MANYLHPGVYVEDKNFGEVPIMEGGATSIGAFVGFTHRVKKEPVLVTSWTDFVNKTSLGVSTPFMKNSYLAYSVYGFFNNGGQVAYIVSATDGTEEYAKGVIHVDENQEQKEISFTAKDAGSWANGLEIKISAGSKAGFFNVEISKKGNVLEIHRDVSFGNENNIMKALNDGSQFVNVDTDVTELTGTGELSVELTGGKDGLSNVSDNDLIKAMKKFDSVDTINLLVIPESQSEELTAEALAYASSRKDLFFIGDGKLNDTFETIQTFKEKFQEDSGALYYPWIEVNDPIGTSKRTKFVPSAGYVAGVIARTDSERGIFKAPAGVQATLRGVIGLKEVITDAQQDILNPKAINVIRAFPDTGIVIWGARTMSNKYINEIRELKYVQHTILNTTKWAVFEPNGPDLWRRIRNQITSFLRGRYEQGAYKGSSEEEAFFVKCDEELNPPSEVNAGRVNTEVGIATNKPGEFIIFRVGQWDGGGEVS